MLREKLAPIGRFIASLAPSQSAWMGAKRALWLWTVLLWVALLIIVGWRQWSWGGFGGVAVATILMLLIGLGLRLGYRLLAAIPAVYRRSALLLSPLLLFFLTPATSEAIAGVLVGLTLVGTGLVGGLVALAREHGLTHLRRPRVAAALVFALLLLVLLPLSIFRPSWLGLAEPRNPALQGFERQDRTLALEDPATMGPYSVETLTYGSGTDRQRTAYGAEVDVRARSVDGSRLVDGWTGLAGKWRTVYWGFDAKALPLQGHVFLPEGDGPFPLVLMVHGNHTMEDFSDGGYGYLGELLASRGAIFVSVDENFLNSSAADLLSGLSGGLEEENDLRAWLLLEHVRQWQEWSEERGHRFEGKVDDDRVILMGHSRGGEAVVTAAAFHRLGRYPDDGRVQFDYTFNLRGVAALAPVDGQYKPRDRPTPILNVDYFVLHGSLDGDVQSFMGSSVFERAQMTEPRPDGEPRFKAGLYIVGGNHGQLNTSWGTCDYGLFWCWSLETGALIAAEDQRRIAQVYLSSFVEAVAHDQFGYRSVFEDPRHAAAWLPAVPLVSNYQQSNALVLADFEEDLDLDTASHPRARLSGEQLTRWRERWPALKWNALDTHLVELAWDDRRLQENAVARYELLLDVPISVGDRTQLAFALADANNGTLPDDDQEDEDQQVDAPGDNNEPDADEETGDGEDEPLDWTVELVDGAGVVARVPLSHDAMLYPRVDSNPGRLPRFNAFEGDEIVLRRYAFDMTAFVTAEPAFDLESVSRVRFVFDRSPRGAILVDDIRLVPAPEPAPGLASEIAIDDGAVAADTR